MSKPVLPHGLRPRMAREDLKRSLAHHIEYTLGKDEYSVTPRDFFVALAHSARDRMSIAWNKTQQDHHKADARTRVLPVARIPDRPACSAIAAQLGSSTPFGRPARARHLLRRRRHLGEDPGLATAAVEARRVFSRFDGTLGLPAIGFGICYEYGHLPSGNRRRRSSRCPTTGGVTGRRGWCSAPSSLHRAFRWPRADERRETTAHRVFLGGYRQHRRGAQRSTRCRAIRTSGQHLAPVGGARGRAKLDISSFQPRRLHPRVQEKTPARTCPRPLPQRPDAAGYELRLKQENFFVSATLQDGVRRHLTSGHATLEIARESRFQLKDTHPAVRGRGDDAASPRRARHGWDQAWADHDALLPPTPNHTIMPEALETWSGLDVRARSARHLLIILRDQSPLLVRIRARRPGTRTSCGACRSSTRGRPRRFAWRTLAIVGSFAVTAFPALHRPPTGGKSCSPTMPVRTSTTDARPALGCDPCNPSRFGQEIPSGEKLFRSRRLCNAETPFTAKLPTMRGAPCESFGRPSSMSDTAPHEVLVPGRRARTSSRKAAMIS